MYIPAHFAPDEALVDELLRNHGAADLVTMTAEGLLATMLPFVYVPPADSGAAAPLGALHGHLARNNGQWRQAATAAARTPTYPRPGTRPRPSTAGSCPPGTT